MSELRLVVSCEHGGRAVPPDYEALFERHEALLDSHRGWDPGALGLAGQFADAFAAPLYAATTARLLIDLDRSLGRRQSFSEITRGLSSAERQAIVASQASRPRAISPRPMRGVLFRASKVYQRSPR